MSTAKAVSSSTGTTAKRSTITSGQKRNATASSSIPSSTSKNNHKNKNGYISFTRPGVEAALRLSQYPNRIDVWDTIEQRYMDMLQAKGGEQLVKLTNDCNALGQRLRGASGTGCKDDTATKNTGSSHHDDVVEQVNFTKNDLMTLVQWKFSKGVPRYPLIKQIESNKESDIKNCANESIQVARRLSRHKDDEDTTTIIDCIKVSIDSFAKLRGVGPATASAFLSWYLPEWYTFMDDEIIEALCPTKKRAYTTSRYIEINEMCRQLSNQLNENNSSSGKTSTAMILWTPHRVGSVLWTASKLASIPNETDVTLQLGTNEDDDDNKDEELVPNPPKRKRR